MDTPRTDAAAIRDNLAQLRGRIAAACQAAGRAPDSVSLLPVTKTVPVAGIQVALEAGYHRFGENRVQEARQKSEALADLDIDWCIIGNLQTNKARHVARFAAELHSLDNLALAQELDRRLQALGRSMQVLVQVNTSGEASKSGLAPDAVPAFLRELPAFSSLRMAGFMTLAANTDDETQVRACFGLLRTIQERARQDGPAGLRFDELSMGMSGDFEWAIAEGATIVRLGSAIFGARDAGTDAF